MTTHELTAAEYRRQHPLPDTSAEIDAAAYRSMVERETASGLLRGMEAERNTEPTAKVEFGEWLALEAAPFAVTTEHRGIDGRQFRFDWAVVELGIAFEYDGVADHATRKGSERDAEKGNLAQLSGWMFIRVNSGSLRDGSGYEVARRAIAMR